MKKSHLKFNVRRLTTCTAIVLAGMLASCSNDDVENKEPEQPVVSEGNTVSLKLISGALQAGRVERVTETKSSLNKKERLEYVGTIKPVEEEREKLNWSATAVAFNADGTKAYVTWHSNMQAENPATAWGGAVDVINIPLELENTAYTDGILKFNHVLYTPKYLFLGSTSATDAGVVGRMELSNDGLSASVDVIGFPGVSVNAVAQNTEGNLVAVSGYKGTYGTFEPEAKAQPYYYGDKTENQPRENVVTTLLPYDENFGGKYVTTDEEGEVYVLFNTESANITKIGGKTVDLGVKLLSAVKVAETYDPITKEWVASTATHDYYGKHVFAVKHDTAYVACGKNGLVVYDLKNEKRLCEDENLLKVKTTGVCVDGDYVYLSTEIGLQVYNWVNGVFHRYAFEVEKYENGLPVSDKSPAAGTDERHSPNFVAVSKTGYIYVAYGQSGVRVYKFREVEE